MRRLLVLALTLGLTSPAAAHVVRPGETLSGIAAAHGLPTAALAAANGVSPDAYVMAGTTLSVPAPGTPPAAPARAVPVAAIAAAPGSAANAGAASTPQAGYRVRVGDTLSAVAARHGLGLPQLAAANGLDPAGVLMAGTVLRLSGTGAAPIGAAAPGPAASAPGGAPGRVTGGDISAIATQHGVPGSLAKAIAWQESGFNNSVVSVAGARGVMQVLPGTWSWIQSSLAGGRTLNPDSPSDNVRAGSLFLADLLRRTGGDQAMAAAAYYQGLGSVRRIGLLPETRKYVANVQALQSRLGN